MNFDNKIFEGNGIFVFSDPAGANSVLAIIDELLLLGHIPKRDFLVFTKSIKGLDEYKKVLSISPYNERDFINVIRTFNPTYIFSGTSLNDFEHLWRKAGIKENVKVISFIDHWTNYIERFSFNNEIIFGDEIWVINEIAKKESIEAGIPGELITVSGNPYHYKVNNFLPNTSKTDFFKEYELDIKKKLILFISDDIKLNFKTNSLRKCILGYDEYSTLENILEALNN